VEARKTIRRLLAKSRMWGCGTGCPSISDRQGYDLTTTNALYWIELLSVLFTGKFIFLDYGNLLYEIVRVS